MLLESLTAQHKGVDNRLWTALVMSIDQIVRKVVGLPPTEPQVEDIVNDNPGYNAPTNALYSQNNGSAWTIE